MTQSGSNRIHGSAYEFLRNNDLDAPNYFDQGSAPPFQRNQFGASLGGPIRTGKTFLFGNYEGLRQHLHETSAAFVPDVTSRAAAVPSVQPLLNLWPIAPAGAPDFNGIAQSSSPRQTIREDFGTARLDQIISSRDTLAAVYTFDDGHDVTATTLDPYSSDILSLREQVLSLEETHTFSPSTLNMARAGFFAWPNRTPPSACLSSWPSRSRSPVGCWRPSPTANAGRASSISSSSFSPCRRWPGAGAQVRWQHLLDPRRIRF